MYTPQRNEYNYMIQSNTHDVTYSFSNVINAVSLDGKAKLQVVSFSCVVSALSL